MTAWAFAFVFAAGLATIGGLAAGAFVAAQRPGFYAEAIRLALPAILSVLPELLARESAEAEARRRATERQGGNTAPTAHGHGGEKR